MCSLLAFILFYFQIYVFKIYLSIELFAEACVFSNGLNDDGHSKIYDEDHRKLEVESLKSGTRETKDVDYLKQRFRSTCPSSSSMRASLLKTTGQELSPSYAPSVEVNIPYTITSISPSITSTSKPASEFQLHSVKSFPSCSKLASDTMIEFSKTSTCMAYQGIRLAFNNLKFNHSSQLQHFLGSTLRLAFHDAGEFDQNLSDLSGPDGCLSNNPANLGFKSIHLPTMVYLEPIYQRYCDKISRADFWALTGKLAAERADLRQIVNINFQFGRKDRLECSEGINRLPSAQGSLDHIISVFVSRMGLTLEDGVTLLGAHSMGNVHVNISGYGLISQVNRGTVNAWDNSPNYLTNEYYQSMLFNKKWTNTIQQNSNSKKNIWSNGGDNIMLNTDLALAFPSQKDPLASIGEVCAYKGGCYNWVTNSYNYSKPPTLAQVENYAKSNAAVFLTAFSKAYSKMICVGYGQPDLIDGSKSQGKLGELTSIDFSTCEVVK
eukprot:gene7455-10165_t